MLVTNWSLYKCQATGLCGHLWLFVRKKVSVMEHGSLKDLKAIPEPRWKLLDAHRDGQARNVDHLHLRLHSNGVFMNRSPGGPSGVRCPKGGFSKVGRCVYCIAGMALRFLLYICTTSTTSYSFSPHQLNQHRCRFLNCIKFLEFWEASDQILVLALPIEMALHIIGSRGETNRSRLPLPCKQQRGCWFRLACPSTRGRRIHVRILLCIFNSHWVSTERIIKFRMLKGLFAFDKFQ